MTTRFSVPIQEADELSDEVVFLPDATAAEWAQILGLGEQRRYGQGDPLVYAGDTDRALYFLVDGCVRVVTSGVPLKSIEAPSVLGEIAFLDGGPRSAGLVAVTDATIVRFDVDAFEELARQDGYLARRMALDLGRIAATRLRLLAMQERHPLQP